MTHTQTYNLNQWEPNDRILREDFNADNAKLDAALRSLSSSLSGKASASTVNSLSQMVAQHTTTLAKKGNCRVYTTSYTGTGYCGDSHKNSLSFPSKPMVVFITGNSARLSLYQGAAFAWGEDTHGTLGYAVYVTWSGNSVSWYSENTKAQMNNGSGTTYNVIALLQTD